MEIDDSSSSSRRAGGDSSRAQGNPDFSERRFWYQILQLQSDIESSLTSASGDPGADLTALFSVRHTREYLIETLGVFGGSFGIAHRSSKEFKLLQWSFFGMPPGLPQLRLPYLDPNTTLDDPRDLSLMDLAFTSLRRYQPLRGRVRLDDLEYRFSPEFYSHLPPAGNSHPCVTAEEEALRGKGWDSLHCTHGEVAFFVWAWLWVRRSAELGRRRVLRLDEDNPDLVLRELSPSPWERSFWDDVREIDAEDPPADVVFADFLHTLLSSNPPHPLLETDVPSAVLAAAREQWQRIMEHDSGTPDDLVKALFIDSSGKWTRSALAAVDFALHLSRKKRATLPNADALNYVRDAERAEAGLENWRITTEHQSNPSHDERRSVLRSLQRIAVFVLLANDHSEIQRISHSETLQSAIVAIHFDAYQALRRLHQIARFPVIHYYCLQSLYGVPLEHFVLPVWTSFKYQEDIFVRNVGEEGRDATTSRVVLALLSILPFWYQSDSTRSSTAIGANGIERLCRIQTLMKHLAVPLIDFGFYGSLVRLEQEATGKRGAFHSTPDAFAYAIEDLVRHQQSCPASFTVPPLLYLASMEAMLSARTRDDINKSAVRLIRAEEIVDEHGGLTTALIYHLMSSTGMVRALAEHRLIRDGIRSPGQIHLELEGHGVIPTNKSETLHVWVLIGILVILLKEAYEHSIKAVVGSDEEPRIRVTINPKRRTLSIANTCHTLDLVKYNQGNQKEVLERLVRHLDNQWRLIYPSVVHDGFVTTVLEGRYDSDVV